MKNEKAFQSRIKNKDGINFKDSKARKYIDILLPYILKYKRCRFLEIGTARGAVSLSCVPNILTVGGHIDTVDYTEGVLVTGKPQRTFEEKMKRSIFVQSIIRDFGLHDIITAYLCGSNSFFEQNLHTYDVMFIDGDHCYEQGKLDIENAVKFLNPGGIIFLDDIADWTQGLQVEESVKRAYLEFDVSGFTKRMSKDVDRIGIIEKIVE